MREGEAAMKWLKQLRFESHQSAKPREEVHGNRLRFEALRTFLGHTTSTIDEQRTAEPGKMTASDSWINHVAARMSPYLKGRPLTRATCITLEDKFNSKNATVRSSDETQLEYHLVVNTLALLHFNKLPAHVSKALSSIMEHHT